MSDLVITSFKYGLDKRRSVLTSQPGTLVTCENGRITEGGEVEKRKAFVLQGTLPHGCFGLQETTAGLLTFTSRRQTAWTGVFVSRVSGVVTLTFALTGSEHSYRAGDVITVSSAGNSTVNGTFTVLSSGLSYGDLTYVDARANTTAADGVITFAQTYPTGVTPQRLISYSMERYAGSGNGSGDPGDNGPYPALTSVIHSRAYNGSASVISAFDAATAVIRTFPATTQFHNAGLASVQYNLGRIQESGANGTDLSFLLFTDFASYLPTSTGYSIARVDPTDPIAALNITADAITGPTAVNFGLSGTDNDNSASLAVSTPIPAGLVAPEVKAYGSFNITAWNASGKLRVTLPNPTNLAATVTVPATTVSFQSSIGQSIANFVRLINSSGYGYSAVFLPLGVNTYTVRIYAPPGLGISMNTLAITPVVDAATVTTSGATTFANGVNGINSAGQVSQVDFTTTVWSFGSLWTLTLADTFSGVTYTIGAGNIANLTPTFLFPLGNKLYMLSGKIYAFSALNDATAWETQNTGAGTVTVSDLSADSTNLLAAASFQGRMALFARRQVQIWTINADPALYSQGQVMQNIGTFAPDSVCPLGDLDVMFLHDSGWRSLRARETTLNAFPNDIGSPIDALIRDSLLTGGANSSAFGIVEPLTGNFWGYLNGVIYVLAYYPSLRLQAWSTYLPTYDVAGVQTSFTPLKFVAYNGRIYVLATDGKVFLYGGTDNATYDGCQVTVQTSFMDHRKPKTDKNATGIDAAIAGAWTLYAAYDENTAFEQVYQGGSETSPDVMLDSTYQLQTIPFEAFGTHFAMKAVSSAASSKVAVLSELVFHYE